MGIVYSCPICGKSVGRKGRPFEDPSKVEAHIDGSHDAIHSGKRGRDYREEIRENTVDRSEIEGQMGEYRSRGPKVDPENITVKLTVPPSGETRDITLVDAMDILSDVAFRPGQFGHTPAEDFEELEGRVDDLDNVLDGDRKRIQELRQAIDALAEIHGTSITWDHFGAPPEDDPFA